MESPIYSIVIPAYNEAQRIGATLEKIITYISQQSWHVELIVVNDGSRDNTVEIVNSYKSRAPYLRGEDGAVAVKDTEERTEDAEANTEANTEVARETRTAAVRTAMCDD